MKVRGEYCESVSQFGHWKVEAGRRCVVEVWYSAGVTYAFLDDCFLDWRLHIDSKKCGPYKDRGVEEPYKVLGGVPNTLTSFERRRRTAH